MFWDRLISDVRNVPTILGLKLIRSTLRENNG